jgi:REP element-mobilizing transposase RayT
MGDMGMKYNRELHRRRSIRLKEYDYSQPGAYFITICAWNRECLFGEINDGKMHLNAYGEIVNKEWIRTANIRSNIELDQYVIMPNHLHGILVINGDCRGTLQRAPTREQFGKPVSNSIPTIIRLFKSAVTKTINEIRNTLGMPVWQRNYYEHVIRNEKEMNSVREYIGNNPLQWADDENNPINFKVR